MVLLPLVRSKVSVPIIAAGGFVDGATMAAALRARRRRRAARHAHGVVGRVARASELEGRDRARGGDRHGVPQPLPLAGAARAAHRAQRAPEKEQEKNAFREFGSAQDLYFGGDMEAAIALTGQACGRIDSVKPVRQILAEIQSEFSRDARGAPAQLRPPLDTARRAQIVWGMKRVLPVRRHRTSRSCWSPRSSPTSSESTRGSTARSACRACSPLRRSGASAAPSSRR